ncbi:hypothetical protein ACS0TY_010211 [Phlomoides rotata]
MNMMSHLILMSTWFGSKIQHSYINMVKEPRWRYERYTPLKMEPTEVLEVVADHPKLKFPYSRSCGPRRPKSNKIYHFRNEYGHDTNNFYQLNDEIERMIQAGNLKKFARAEKNPENKYEDKRKAPQDDLEDQPQPSQRRGTI